MAAVAPISLLIFCPNYNPRHKTLWSLPLRSKSLLQQDNMFSSSYSFFSSHPSSVFRSRLLFRIAGKGHVSRCNCYDANKPSPSSEISSIAKIRSEVLSPFRSVRMFFYLAFIASSTLGGLIAITQLVSALANPSKASVFNVILKGLGIDLAAILFFAFLYARENKAKNAQLAKLSREESLSQLKLHVYQSKIISVSDLRGIARLVILVGPTAYINESFKRSEAFTDALLERGVLVVPFVTDESQLEFESEDSKEKMLIDQKEKWLWQLRPVFVTEWNK